VPDFELDEATLNDVAALEKVIGEIKPKLGQKRGDGLKICVGDKIHRNIEMCKLFMVGAGAIGCELLKNYAMLGVGVGEEQGKKGSIVLTDPDTIENSNLNRQFLFREQHISKPKS